MSLMPQILVSGQFGVDALGLKNHADLTPQTRRFLRRIASHDYGASGSRNHESRKNPE